MLKRVNLGCGYDLKDGYLNVDKVNHDGVMFLDLNVYPWPFKDNSFFEVNASFILEHVSNPKMFLDEVVRILKVGGKAYIRTEHFSSWAIWGDITHVRPFNSTSLDHLRIDKKQFNLLDKNDHHCIIKPYLKINFLLDRIVNLHNATRCFFERSFLVHLFPVKEVDFIIEKI